jgi:hypothetical protein
MADRVALRVRGGFSEHTSLLGFTRRRWLIFGVAADPPSLPLPGELQSHPFAHTEWESARRRLLEQLLLDEEDLAEVHEQRDRVAPAKASTVVQSKKQRKQTEQGFPVQSFSTLIQALATRSRNTCQVQSRREAPTFEQVARATPLYAKASDLPGL